MSLPPLHPAAALARHPFLADAVPEPLARLVGHARWIDAAADHLVADFEDATTDVFFIVQGAVRVLLRTPDGEHTQILGDRGAGDLVGEMAAIDDVPRSARIEALVRTRICAVSAKAFKELLRDSHPTCLRLLRLLTARIRAHNQRLLEFTALTTRWKVAAELLRLSRPKPDGSLVLSPPETQEELAARVGARRETVSRGLKRLERDGLIQHTSKAYLIPDAAALRAAINAALDRRS